MRGDAGRIGAVRAPRSPRLRPARRADRARPVDFTELVPEPVRFLGQAAYLQLEFFENLVAAVAHRTHAGREVGAERRGRRRAAQAPRRSSPSSRRLDDEPDAVMEPFRPRPIGSSAAPQGADWYEILAHLPRHGGNARRLLRRASPTGCPIELGDAGARASSHEEGEAVVLVAELRAAIDASPRLAVRLAMWGRRLVGDTLLIARSALRAGEAPDRSGEQVEPVFTELIADHTRRMDALGPDRLSVALRGRSARRLDRDRPLAASDAGVRRSGAARVGAGPGEPLEERGIAALAPRTDELRGRHGGEAGRDERDDPDPAAVPRPAEPGQRDPDDGGDARRRSPGRAATPYACRPGQRGSGPRCRGSRRRGRRRGAPSSGDESDAARLLGADLDVGERRGRNDVDACPCRR